MRKISAIAVFSGVLLAAGIAALVYIAIVRPMPASGTGEAVPTEAATQTPTSEATRETASPTAIYTATAPHYIIPPLGCLSDPGMICFDYCQQEQNIGECEAAKEVMSLQGIDAEVWWQCVAPGPGIQGDPMECAREIWYSTPHPISPMGAATVTPTPPDLITMRITNVQDNQASICYVHLAEAGTGDWQPDVIGSSVIVYPDSEHIVYIPKPAALYDVIAYDCEYNVIFWALNNAYDPTTPQIEVPITQTGERIWVDNMSTQPICEVSIDRVSGAQSQVNLLEDTIDAGTSRSFDAPPAYYNLRVVFCDGRVSERRDFYHSEQTHWEFTD